MARMIPAPAGGPRTPVWVWGRSAPEGAIDQMERLAAQPYIVGHVAAMPDLHVAHGIAVGTVFTTDGVVVPSALGGDLGCGVGAVRFDFPARALSGASLQRILAGWAGRIPVGDGVQRGKGAIVPEASLAEPLSRAS